MNLNQKFLQKKSNQDIIGLFDPEDTYAPTIANNLRSSGFEPFFYTDLAVLLEDAKKHAMVCVVNGDLIDNNEISDVYKEIAQLPNIRLISVSNDGSFDARVKLARHGIDCSMFRPIENHALAKTVNSFYQKLYPGNRDIMLASLLDEESKVFPILDEMNHINVVRTEIREVFYNLEHYDQIMTIVEADLNNDKGADLLKAISASSSQSDAPILLICPKNGDELAFLISTRETYPVSFKVYADSLPEFVELIMDTAKLNDAVQLYDDTDVINSSYHHQKIIDLIEFSDQFNIPLSVCSFKIDCFYDILKEKGKEESRKLYNKLSHIVSEKMKHTDFKVRIAMDRMVIFFLGDTEHECQQKAAQLKEMFKVMPNTYQNEIYLVTLSVGLLQISDSDYINTMELLSKAVEKASFQGGDQVILY